MKKLTQKIKKIIFIGVLFFTTQVSYGQWSTLWTPSLQTPFLLPAVGIGYSAASNWMNSALHINSFLTAPGTFSSGELFRTEATNAQINAWRMFNGPAVGGTSEKFSVQVFPVGGAHNGSGTSGYQVSLSAPVANDEIWMENNQMGLWTGNRPYIFMSENFGGTPDVINIGDGNSSINTTIFADDLVSGTSHRGVFQRGDNGNMHIGNWMSDYPVLNNVQMDVIGKAISQTSLTPFRDFDCVFKGRISDDTSSFIRLANATNTDLQFVPMIHGHFDNQGGDYKMGLAVLGSINPANDVYVMGVHPVMDFDVRTYDPTHGNLQGVTQRDLFRWRNFATNEMLMNSDGKLGLKTITPKNRLEIVAQATDSDPFPGSGQSGLRLTGMSALFPPAANPGIGVLSVDKYGDVIYVQSGGGSGNACGAATTNPLTSDWEIPLNGNNYVFSSNPGTSTGAVGIGNLNTACSPLAKLDVQNDASNAGNKYFAGIFNTFGIDSTPMVSYYGVQGISQVKGSPWNNIGGSFVAWNCDYNNIGVTGDANGQWGHYNIGGRFISGNSTGGNIGTFGMALPGWGGGISYPAVVDIGVYGNAQKALATRPSYAGFFDGDVHVNGFNSGVGYLVASDQQFKTNVDTISNAINLIKQLHPKTYYLDTANAGVTYGFNFPSKRQYGFLAQEVEQVLPELIFPSHKPAMVDSLGNVVTQSLDYKSINYIEFIPLLMRGIQEQSRTIDSLKSKTTKQDSINNSLQNQLNDLRTIINNCCTANQNHAPIINNGNDKNNTSAIDVKLSDGQSVVLSQNVPNPFAEQTTINYTLPDNTGKAQMLFYNAGGKLIKSVELNERGQGQLNVFAEDLTNGMYTYTLVVDGKVMATKKMVKQ